MATPQRNPQKSKDMIQEGYVAFETAKLLKEAGFPQIDDNGICATIKYFSEDGDFLFDSFDFSESGGDVAVPTQVQAMRWLREEKAIFISVYPVKEVPFNGVFLAEIQRLHNGFPWTYNYYRGESYEDALESALWASCKYLIEKQEGDQL